MRSVAQNLSERIGESPWLSQLDDVSVGHGVSLLWWRSGGVEYPHDTPPYPFMPSPTSAHSSRSAGVAELLRYRDFFASRNNRNRIADALGTSPYEPTIVLVIG